MTSDRLMFLSELSVPRQDGWGSYFESAILSSEQEKLRDMVGSFFGQITKEPVIEAVVMPTDIAGGAGLEVTFVLGGRSRHTPTTILGPNG